MSTIRKGTCAAPGPYGAHCTDYPGHQYSCYDASDDVSFNDRSRDEWLSGHQCDDPTCQEPTS